MLLERLFWTLLDFFTRTREMAAKMAESNNEDSDDYPTMAWYVFVLLSGFGFGALAVRWFWISIPGGDHSFGGFAFILFAMVVFGLGFAVGVFLLGKIGAPLSGSGRFTAGVGVISLVIIGLVLPMRTDFMAVSQKPTDRETVSQQAILAEVPVQSENLPFVPPVAVPDMLVLMREGDAMRVTNRSGVDLMVSVALVLPHDKLMDRCQAVVVVGNCQPGSAVCAQQAGSEVAEAVAGITSINTNPLIAAGQAATFITSHCDPQFANGAPEFQVWSNAENRYLFKSESTLIQDYH